MPELPEVETVVRTLRPHVVGLTISSARFGSKFVTPGDRELLAARLVGRRIEGVERRGKFIWVRLDSGSLAIHLGMTGRLLFGGVEGPHTHGVFSFDDAVLVYDDIRQFGRIECSEEGVPARIAALGPDALGIGVEEFVSRLRARSTRVKPLLLNQSFLAGLGNIYVDEALFRAGVHPLARASGISKARAAGLHSVMGSILRTAIEHGGSSISDYVDADGASGEFQKLHRVYGREGLACVVCGALVKRIVVAGRGTHYCGTCQRR